MLAGWSPAARAQAGGLYRWTDAAGGVHYTQGLDSVPAEFRSQAVRVGGGPERRGPTLRAQGSGGPSEAEMEALGRELDKAFGEMAEAMARALAESMETAITASPELRKAVTPAPAAPRPRRR
jgi:hypothetical protein